MSRSAIVSEFEARTGFSLPPGYGKALAGDRAVFIRERNIFADDVQVGPLPAEAAALQKLEDFGFVFGPVDNYMGWREENCLSIDPFNTGDAVMLVGQGGKLGPALLFADHETGDIVELFADIDTALRYEEV